VFVHTIGVAAAVREAVAVLEGVGAGVPVFEPETPADTVADDVTDCDGVTEVVAVAVAEGNGAGPIASERHSVLPQLCARPANVDVTVSNVTIQLPTVEAPAATAGTEFVNASVK